MRRRVPMAEPAPRLGHVDVDHGDDLSCLPRRAIRPRARARAAPRHVN
jgi:hypothetical protein